MTYVIGVDVGGTFTDAFAADDNGNIVSAKAPSTPADFSRGVLQAVTELANRLDRPVEQLFGETSYIAHGTTATLNALVTGNVSKVGFITTKGHRDSIYIMNLEGRYAGLGPEEVRDIIATRKPAPLIPKRRAKEVTERVDYKGSVMVALNEDEARQAVRELLDEGVEAIAVSLLWSFLNPAHERRIREIVHEMAPDLYVGLSSEISPRIREYARNATTIMSTQVGPTLRDYLKPLKSDLTQMGLQAPLLIMQGSGGTVSAEEAPGYAITTIGSVLTGGVVGATMLGERLGHKNIISTDVGGTTFLVGLVVDGEAVFTNTTTMNQYNLNVPMMQVNSIGSGGGAIAWLDEGGNLRVGPRSAGASPGPACYGAGGEEPTVTDADLVLGIINPDFFLGGKRLLDVELAKKALKEQIGDPLGLSAEEAAAAVFEIQNAQTADLVRKVVVETGYDPRDFAMYAFGGAGPVHCFAYGAELGVQEIVVPLGQTAAVFSAYGLAASDVVLSAELSDPANFPVGAENLNSNFEQLERDVRARLDAQGVKFADVTVQREIDIRYTMQIFEVPTPVKNGKLDEGDIAQIAADFEEKYATLFGKGTGFSEAGFQFITYRVFATGHLPFKPQLPEAPSANGYTAKGALKEHRRVLLDTRLGWRETPIYDYGKLAAGHVLEGPAVVEAPTTTVVISAGSTGSVDHLGNVVIRYGQGGE
ncbi:hydantoinase/oxoprolinase family protein [Rubrobacter marinus]|uniref:Hydantoinase/oxoprolinase family protein n=1 Tax=Rubrobacter marinus TaxID=2653852 RepID=A0A6G8Q0Q0_9ACTN|nr:hydantoinase/oxoprolinase family protein [Rubrobacter marinus]QIN80000.1 hydantoinase/oxoprolinase family protein [Rubrobacter marinus]